MFGAFGIFSMIVVIMLMILMFKLTLFTFRVVGKVIGWVWGILGWLIVGILAVSVCGLAVFSCRSSWSSDCFRFLWRSQAEALKSLSE